MHAFDHFGGVTEEILYDRMKTSLSEEVSGKNIFNDTLTGFALHYGFKPQVAPTYAARVKGKVERLYHFIREGFWRGHRLTLRSGGPLSL
jgi:transposase